MRVFSAVVLSLVCGLISARDDRLSDDCLYGRADRWECCHGVPNSWYAHLRNPEDCASFYQCTNGKPELMPCPIGLEWSVEGDKCAYPAQAKCKQTSKPTEQAERSTSIPFTESTRQEELNSAEVVIDTSRDNSKVVLPNGCYDGSIHVTVCCVGVTAWWVHLPDPKDCSKFYHCDNGKAVHKNCPAGLHWSVRADRCEWPANADCKGGKPIPPPTTQSTAKPTNLPTSPQSDSSVNGSTSTNKPNEITSATPSSQPASPTQSSSESGSSQTSTKAPTTLPGGCYDSTIDVVTCCRNVSDKWVHLPDPADCTKFYHCDNGKAVHKDCPAGLHWSVNADRCEWPAIANCKGDKPTLPPTLQPTAKPTNSPATPQTGSSTNKPTEITRSTPVSQPNSSTVAPTTTSGASNNESTREATNSQGNFSTTTTPSITSSSKPSEAPNKLPEGCYDSTIDVAACCEGVTRWWVHLPDPEDCSKFYHCDNGKAVHKNCPAGLHWSVAADRCEWPSIAKCQSSGKPTKPTAKPTDPPAITTTTFSNISSQVPTEEPTTSLSEAPKVEPTGTSTEAPVKETTSTSTEPPTKTPTKKPTDLPTNRPTSTTTKIPTIGPSSTTTEAVSTLAPTNSPTNAPSEAPLTDKTDSKPTTTTIKPTGAPTEPPTKTPTNKPTDLPTNRPTKTTPKTPTNGSSSTTSETASTLAPTNLPTNPPSEAPATDETASQPTRKPEFTTSSTASNLPTEKSTDKPQNIPNGCYNGTVDVNICCEGISEWWVHLPDPQDCSKFYHCDNGKAVSKDCPAGLHWSITADRCEWPSIAGCKPSSKPVTTTTVKPTEAPASTTQPEIETSTKQATQRSETTTLVITTTQEHITSPRETTTQRIVSSTVEKTEPTSTQQPTKVVTTTTARPSSESPSTFFTQELTKEATQTTTQSAADPSVTPSSPQVPTVTTTEFSETTTPFASSSKTATVLSTQSSTEEIVTTVKITSPATVQSTTQETETSTKSQTASDTTTKLPSSASSETTTATTLEPTTQHGDEPTKTPTDSSTGTTPQSSTQPPVKPPTNECVPTPVCHSCLTGVFPAKICCQDIPNWQKIHLADPDDCSSYYDCENREAVHKKCPTGLHWSTKSDRCEWPSDSGCSSKTTESPANGSTNNNEDVETTTNQWAGAINKDCLYGETAPEICCKNIPFWIDILLQNNDNCHTYYQCVHGRPMIRYCPSNLWWSATRNRCDWLENATCTRESLPNLFY